MTVCPLCQKEAVRRFDVGHTIVWLCSSSDCELQFAEPQLDAESLAHAYAKHYYPSNGNAVVYENTPEEILRQTFNGLEIDMGLLAGKSLLDFGCGIGTLCQVAKEYGIHPVGVESDPNAREKATRIGGLETFSDIKHFRQAQPSARFDIVTMWDVIEHLREPWKELRDLASVLKPNGWLLLSTPNAASFRARVLGTRWENMMNSTHFYYFTRTSLAATLRRGGFEEPAELDIVIEYPAHGLPRRLFHRLIRAARFQGQLIYLAKQRLESHCEAVASSGLQRGSQ